MWFGGGDGSSSSTSTSSGSLFFPCRAQGHEAQRHPPVGMNGLLFFMYVFLFLFLFLGGKEQERTKGDGGWHVQSLESYRWAIGVRKQNTKEEQTGGLTSSRKCVEEFLGKCSYVATLEMDLLSVSIGLEAQVSL